MSFTPIPLQVVQGEIVEHARLAAHYKLPHFSFHALLQRTALNSGELSDPNRTGTYMHIHMYVQTWTYMNMNINMRTWMFLRPFSWTRT